MIVYSKNEFGVQSIGSRPLRKEIQGCYHKHHTRVTTTVYSPYYKIHTKKFRCDIVNATHVRPHQIILHSVKHKVRGVIANSVCVLLQQSYPYNVKHKVKGAVTNVVCVTTTINSIGNNSPSPLASSHFRGCRGLAILRPQISFFTWAGEGESTFGRNDPKGFQ